MQKVTRDEILGLGPYEQVRERFRARLIDLKKRRRVHVGPTVTITFENRDTVLYQIQEMVRTERMTADRDIQHEVDTYNELIPDPGCLSATVMIEEPDPEVRDGLLRRLVGFFDHVWLVVGAERVAPRWSRHAADESDKISSVQYAQFPLGPLGEKLRAGAPAAIEIDHPSYTHRTDLATPVARSLVADLD